ncbi:MAG: hypothetical protein J1F11_05675 [Oscillospiraceae bacterium]|nr:hypothetical protein [Oscillospiraceae bacterium]
MSLIDDLKALGANTDEALGRFMGNASLYERMLGKLPPAVESNQVMPCFESGDNQGALEKAHTLKGVTGNLSLTPLYKAYSDAVTLLRDNKPDEAKEIIEKILPVQDEFIACIEKNK